MGRKFKYGGPLPRPTGALRRRGAAGPAWALISFRPCLLLAALLFSALALPGCREQDAWDQEIAAKVNGRPIPRAALDRVLEWGFYPDLDQGGERELNLPLILDKLITEELILGEARKAGLKATPAEIDAELAKMESALFGADPPRPERAELRQALSSFLLVRKMTEKVIADRRVLSADKWRDFWEKWPKDRAPSFQVRALLLPPSEQDPEKPEKMESLDELVVHFRKEGLAAILSQPLWLSGGRLDPLVVEELRQAFRQGRLSVPVRLDESWAIYEVLGLTEAPSAAEEFELARQSFESLADEEAFRQWMAEVRAAAKIEYAPQLGPAKTSPR